MTTGFVPNDIFLKHENEWQALREAADDRIDVGKRETPRVTLPRRSIASPPGRDTLPALRPE